MNGFLLLVPFLLIRFILLSKLNKEAIKRAAHFPTMHGNEILAYWIYQIANVAIFVYLCFLTVIIKSLWVFVIGVAIYILGLLLCTIAIVHFASPLKDGFNCNGIYRLSRNPMYLSYFFIFIGCSIITQSIVLWMIVLIFQTAAHWIILAEELWCIEKFGNFYRDYMIKVRRYI